MLYRFWILHVIRRSLINKRICDDIYINIDSRHSYLTTKSNKYSATLWHVKAANNQPITCRWSKFWLLRLLLGSRKLVQCERWARNNPFSFPEPPVPLGGARARGKQQRNGIWLRSCLNHQTRGEKGAKRNKFKGNLITCRPRDCFNK